MHITIKQISKGISVYVPRNCFVQQMSHKFWTKKQKRVKYLFSFLFPVCIDFLLFIHYTAYRMPVTHHVRMDSPINKQCTLEIQPTNPPPSNWYTFGCSLIQKQLQHNLLKHATHIYYDKETRGVFFQNITS